MGYPSGDSIRGNPTKALGISKHPMGSMRPKSPASRANRPWSREISLEIQETRQNNTRRWNVNGRLAIYAKAKGRIEPMGGDRNIGGQKHR